MFFVLLVPFHVTIFQVEFKLVLFSQINTYINHFLQKAFTEEETKLIVTSRAEAAALKIAHIKNNTKLQLETLRVKYVIPDTIKTTCGYIAIGSLSSLATLVILNECFNLFKYVFDKKKLVKKQNNKITPKPVYLSRAH